MKLKRLKFEEWEHLIPTYPSRIRTNHNADDCEGGRDSMIVELKEDGSANAHCFRCNRSGFHGGDRYFKSPRKTPEAKSTRHSSTFGKNLPGDSHQEWSGFPRDVKEWLLKGGVTTPLTFGVWWSDSQEKLWIEVRQYSKVTSGHKVAGYVVRGFNPKFYRTATNDPSNFFGYYVAPPSVINNKKIVIVEDVVSALRVSQVVDCIAIMGVHPSPAAIQHILSNGYRKAFVWLDGDNPTVKMKAREIAARLPFVSTTVVDTGKDPKYYSAKEITEILK